MSWKDFMNTVMGRIGSTTVALLGGVCAWYASDPDNPMGVWVMSIAFTLAVCGFIFAIGLSLEVAPGKTIAMIFLVPLIAEVLFAYIRNLDGPSADLAMACGAVAALSAVLAVTGGKFLPGESTA